MLIIQNFSEIKKSDNDLYLLICKDVYAQGGAKVGLQLFLWKIME